MNLKEKLDKLYDAYGIWLGDHDCPYGRKGEFLVVQIDTDEAFEISAATQEEAADKLLAAFESTDPHAFDSIYS